MSERCKLLSRYLWIAIAMTPLGCAVNDGRDPGIGIAGSGQYEGKRVCPVHQELFNEDVVKVVYGSTWTPAGFFHAQETRFPYSGRDNFIGHGVGPDRSRIYYCPSCRRAYDQFFEEARAEARKQPRT